MTQTLTDRVDALVARELSRIKNPERRARAAHELAESWPGIGGTIRVVRADAIRALKKDGDGRTWEAIGTLLGVTKQRAEQLSRVSLEDAIR